MKIYANDNGGEWTIPPFDESASAIDYRVPVGGGDGTPNFPSRSQESISGPGGATKLSTTRAFWMMVRSGDITVKQFICPVSTDKDDRTEDLDHYYDFEGYTNISYGFQVPYGPPNTRPRVGRDNRMALAADKGPFINGDVAAPPPSMSAVSRPPYSGVPQPAGLWSKFNSPNHHGEGQSVLFADGHSQFVTTPTVGVDNDNIYTIALDNWNESSRVAGESPWTRAAPPYSPTASDGTPLASTDSVIFP